MHTIFYFASLAAAHECVRVQNIMDFPQTKLDSGINAPFLLNEHSDPHEFYFLISMSTILLKSQRKYQQKCRNLNGYVFGR